MAVTVDDLVRRLRVKDSEGRRADLEGILGQAATVVADLVEDAYRAVPPEVVDQAVVAVAREINKRDQAPTAGGQYATPDASPQPRGRRPRDVAFEALQGYVGQGL